MIKKSFLFVLLFALFVVSCTPAELRCTQDSDCVAAKCCHAASAVNQAHAPDCEGVICSQSCEPGTLDCNQGKIACVSGKCSAVFG